MKKSITAVLTLVTFVFFSIWLDIHLGSLFLIRSVPYLGKIMYQKIYHLTIEKVSNDTLKIFAVLKAVIIPFI